MKKFLEAVSADKELAARMPTDKNTEALLALAREAGCKLTEEDLRPTAEELSEDELSSVVGGVFFAHSLREGGLVMAGGSSSASPNSGCACFRGGSGAGDANDQPCNCIAMGAGYSSGSGNRRCFCSTGGTGVNS